MKLRKLIKSENGAAVPFIVLILVLGLFGFVTLVVDVGFMYNTRKEMVTAADAGALAGAIQMEKSLGLTDATAIQNIKIKAIEIAKNVAIRNGAEGIPVVTIKKEYVELSAGAPEYRDVIEVKVLKNEKLIFAHFLGKNDTNISAKAVATWGYSQEVTGGQILPLFMLEQPYLDGSDIMKDGNIVNDGKTYESNWGFAYIDESLQGQNDLNILLNGTNVDKKYKIEALIPGKSGKGQSLIGAIEGRINIARGMATKEARQQFMTGLVPIVDIESDQGGQLTLRIKYFAVYLIKDIIEDNNSNGYIHALDGENYTSDGIAKNYKSVYPPGLEKGTVVGEFTNETIELSVIVTAGDQDIAAGLTGMSTYSRLID